MRIAVELDHHKALAAYLAAGQPFPEIPEGKNTVWHHFVLDSGECAMIVNQRGFAAAAADNEEQVNGCLLAVAIDAADDSEAIDGLESWIQEMLSDDHP